MSNFKLKASHAPVKDYYATLEKFGRGKFDNEGNIRRAFESLLEKCARPFEWFLVSEYPISRTGKNPLKVDAAILDAFNLPRGYWEAKDEKDDLKAEMDKKFALGYPRTNILFQKPTHAILFQDGRIVFNEEIVTPENLVEVLRRFFEWRQPHQEDWDRAVREFSERVPEIAKGAMALIAAERKTNPTFVARFTAFAELCRESINPDLKDEAVEEMLVQHLLTERIFRRIFDNPEFTRRNVIAAEIEKVIDSLTKKHFSRDSFLRDLDPFYKAIEETAATASSYSEKQAFLNSVYERFFQGFSKKQADTHGIVYTPQPIVDFMVRSVEEVLKTEFGRSLSDKGVHILDPFVGTGNFITRVMKEIRTSSLPHKYKEELHCNEIMLLPYYIASMNIEHAYLDRVGEYEPFQGICLVDSFELARQSSLFSTENTARILRQRNAPITVIFGNPPYNVGQARENDKNTNRKYPGKQGIDARVSETYAAASFASTTSRLNDPYIKAIRWATDRLGNNGVIAYVTNNGFLTRSDSDGVRKYLAAEFDLIYIIDLGANIRKNPDLSGTTHNVFGIKPGVSIELLIRKETSRQGARIEYLPTKRDWRKAQRLDFLDGVKSLSAANWEELRPDERNSWFSGEDGEGFSELIPLGSAAVKEGSVDGAIMGVYSLGANTNRDSWAYNFREATLANSIRRFMAAYNTEVGRWIALSKPEREDLSIDDFLTDDESIVKWGSTLKQRLKAGELAEFNDRNIVRSLYRPFCCQFQYLARLITHRPGWWPSFIPKGLAPENLAFCASGVGAERPFASFATSTIPDLNFFGPGSVPQWYPFYIYEDDGTNRRENITDWALAQFRKHYADDSISKWDIFHYAYALLHHPEYRTRYAANLKRELPRIPMAPAFRDYARIGAVLMDLHINYEQQPEYDLQRTETGKLNWRVEKMSLSKDKTQLKYNGFLTLSGIPPQVYDYRLGNRSALEWIVDQYRVSTDARSGIVNDPNRDDDPEYIVRLIGQVVTVSLETVMLVKELETLSIDQA